jgi:hypothetical protein
VRVETIQSSLSALKSSGSVFGVILAHESHIIYADVPFAQDRVGPLAAVLDDIGFYFKKENRKVDQLAFGYDGGSLVVVMDEAYRIIVLHSLVDEIDFIAKSAKSFLIDYQMGLFAAEFEKDHNQERAIAIVSPEPQTITPEQIRVQEPMRPGTQRIALRAEKGFNQTEPLQARPNRPPQARRN